jgi:hypothetical protein
MLGLTGHALGSATAGRQLLQPRRDDGRELRDWNGGEHQLLGNVTGAVATPVPAGLTASFLDIGVSEQCAVGAADRKITCWGGEDSKLGALPAGTFQQVGVGLDFACALDTSGKISCWGDDSFAQTSAPTGTFVQLATGKHHSCALSTDGNAVCWGLGGPSTPTDGGTTGDTTSDGTESPWGQSIAPTNQKFAKLAVGLIHSCGISTSGDVTC